MIVVLQVSVVLVSVCCSRRTHSHRVIHQVKGNWWRNCVEAILYYISYQLHRRGQMLCRCTCVFCDVVYYIFAYTNIACIISNRKWTQPISARTSASASTFSPRTLDIYINQSKQNFGDAPTKKMQNIPLNRNILTPSLLNWASVSVT